MQGDLAKLQGCLAAGAQPGSSQQSRWLATALWNALIYRRMENAHYLLSKGPWAPQHVGEVLAKLIAAGDAALPLYPALVAQTQLAPEHWARVPLACPGLGAALPAGLRSPSSSMEAVLLVRRMPDNERRYLRTLALCLGVAQRRGKLPPLPAAITDRLLADCVAHYAAPPAAPPEQQRVWQLRRLQACARTVIPHKLGLLAAALVAVLAAAVALLLAAWT